MATAEATMASPQLAGTQTRADGRHGPSAQSKREKKRQQLSDRLAALSDQLDRDRDHIFRDELQKIQVDTTLAMRVDPFDDRPLEDVIQENMHLPIGIHPGPQNQNNSRTLLDMSGPKFEEWMRDVEDLVENKDFEITRLEYEFRKKDEEIRNTCAYKTEVAKREHHALSKTLRDRLINTIMSKKFRLNKEKEALEISDASALLLHPNQFSITNPASPGGTHSKRSTRQRHQLDELSGFADSKKRKRNGGEDDGSPAPHRRNADGTTPLWQGERVRANRNVAGPIYSMDKLFTDKELSLTYNAAALAAHKHILTHKVASNGNAGSSPDDSDVDDDSHRDVDLEVPEVAPMMERQVSHSTRSTRGGAHPNFVDDKVVGIEGLANFDYPKNLEKMSAMEPRLPPLVPTQYSKAYGKGEANQPTPLPLDDVQHDLVAMGRLKQYEIQHGSGSSLDAANGGRRVLEAVSKGPQESQDGFVAYISHERHGNNDDDSRKDMKLPASSIRDEHLAPSAQPMSRQSSLGGTVMSRQGSSKGRGRRG